MVHFETRYCHIVFLDREYTVLTSCTLSSSRLHDFIRYSYLYSVMITIYIFFGGGGSSAFFLGGGEASTPKIP